MSKGATVQVLDRGLDIIEQLSTSEKGMSLLELSAATGLPKPTVHRILQTFTQRQYVNKDPDTSIYSIGNRFVEITSIYLNKLVLKTEAEPIMRRIASSFKAIAYLGILGGNDVVYLAKIEPLNNLRMYSDIGKREPLFCTSLGKVLLSSLPQDELSEKVRALHYRAYTSRTITDPDALLREVREVQINGFALDRGEHEPDNSCIGVPIYDYTRQIIAAMSLSGYGLLETYPIETLHKEMKAASLELSQRMGYIMPDKS